MRVVCQNSVSTFADHFIKDVENWKRFKKDHGNYLGDGENVLYSKTLRLSKEESVLKVYPYFAK